MALTPEFIAGAKRRYAAARAVRIAKGLPASPVYIPIPLEEKRRNWSRAAKQRGCSHLYNYQKQNHLKCELRVNLRILQNVIRTIRNRLLFPEKNRARALKAYHAKGDNRRRARLVAAYRRAIDRQSQRRDALIAASYFVVRKFNRRVRSRLVRCLRRRFEKVVAGKDKSAWARRLVGCDLSHLQRHLEQQFKPGMSWTNRSQWHVDHIKPVAKFDLSDPAQVLECFHFTNLQPLWAKENLEKSDNWPTLPPAILPAKIADKKSK
jgi:hypothetical protein